VCGTKKRVRSSVLYRCRALHGCMHAVARAVGCSSRASTVRCGWFYSYLVRCFCVWQQAHAFVCMAAKRKACAHALEQLGYQHIYKCCVTTGICEGRDEKLVGARHITCVCNVTVCHVSDHSALQHSRCASGPHPTHILNKTRVAGLGSELRAR